MQDKLNGFESGADDYLTSPFAFEELLARVKVRLSRNMQLNTNVVLEEADLYLDAENHEVVRGGISIYLTKKEFFLLQYLLQRKGKVLSRALIEEQVWGYQKDSMTNVMDVYIQKLRKKVDLKFGRLLIHTVRGFVYELKATERRSPNRIPDQLYYHLNP